MFKIIKPDLLNNNNYVLGTYMQETHILIYNYLGTLTLLIHCLRRRLENLRSKEIPSLQNIEGKIRVRFTSCLQLRFHLNIPTCKYVVKFPILNK